MPLMVMTGCGNGYGWLELLLLLGVAEVWMGCSCEPLSLCGWLWLAVAACVGVTVVDCGWLQLWPAVAEGDWL